MVLQFSALSSVCLAFSTFGWLPAETVAQPVRPAVLVMVQNDANVAPDLLERAQREVVKLFTPIDVEIAWVTEVPKGVGRLRVVSLTTWEPGEQKVEGSVLGYTQVAQGKRGVRAYVFWRRVDRASQKFTASLDKVLAVAIAHEIGHMLLPDGKHARAGLMGGPWDANHFRSAAAGLLAFSPDSARLIRRELEKEGATPVASSSVR